MPFARIVSVFLILSSIATASGPGTAVPLSIPLRVSEGFLLVDGVFLNGAGPYRFLVDTGATTNQLDAVLAESLAMKATYRVELVTVSGSRAVPAARVAKIQVGPVSADDIEMLWMPLTEVRKVDRRIQGVLGQDFLRRFNYVLDFRGHRIVFEPATVAGEEIPAERVEGRLAVHSAEDRVLGRRRLILDSGANTLCLFSAEDVALDPLSSVRLQTATGSTEGRFGKLRELRLGSQVYRDIPAAMLRSAKNGEGADGILPLRLFKAVYVNNARNVVILDPVGF